MRGEAIQRNEELERVMSTQSALLAQVVAYEHVPTETKNSPRSCLQVAAQERLIAEIKAQGEQDRAAKAAQPALQVP